MGHSIGSDLEKDLTQPTCRSRLIHHTLDGLSVTFFPHRHPCREKGDQGEELCDCNIDTPGILSWF